MTAKGLINSQELFVSRVLFTLAIILIIRFGIFVPIPEIDQQYLFIAMKKNPTLSMLSAFSQGDFFVLGLFSLGILPNINASIIMQLITTANKGLQKLQKEEGSAGRKKITQITRYLTLGIAVLYSVPIAYFAKPFIFNWGLITAVEIVVALVTGAMIVLWFSELITEKGIGNGPSLFICIGIISALPTTIQNILNSVNFVSLALLLFFISIIIVGIIFVQEATRVIPILSAKQLLDETSNPNPDFLPFRLNQGGVMPIIFSSTILAGFSVLGNLDFFQKFPVVFSGLYFSVYFLSILFFSYFYSTIVVDPTNLAEDLNKMAVSIPGIRPGTQTKLYLEKTLNRLAILGGLFLAGMAILPNIISFFAQTNALRGFGSTSLIILVGAAIDISIQVRTLLIYEIYNDMVK